MEKISRDVLLEGPLSKLPEFRRGSFIWVEHRILAAGRYTLEAAVLDQEAGGASARKVAFAVPESSEGITLSSVMLTRRVEPEPGGRNAEDPLHFSGGKVTPTLSASVPGGPDSALSMYFVIYPDRSNSRQPELEIDLVRDGKLLARSAPPLAVKFQ